MLDNQIKSNQIKSEGNPVKCRSRSGHRPNAHAPRLAPLPLAVALALLAGAPTVHAGPGGEQIVAGQAAVSRSGNTTLITQTSDRAAINWQSFNIGAAEAVRFAQPSTSSIVR